MEALKIEKGDVLYPVALTEYLSDAAPPTLNAIGNLEILNLLLLGLFCSRKCSGTVILKSYDLMQSLRASGIPMIGAFHSPVERECLTILLRGKNPIVICLARSFERKRIPIDFRKPIQEGRLLLLSPFSDGKRRADKSSTTKRNAIIAALAQQILVPHAEPNSKTENLCREILTWGKTLYVFEENCNRNLLDIGAQPVSPTLDLV